MASSSLYSDVISNRRKGRIHQVWLTAGHTFVCLDDGRKLITFDAKHADYICTSEVDGCLDLHVDSPIKCVFFFPPSLTLIVQQDGTVQVWSYKSEPQRWQQHGSMMLCDIRGASVVSVNLDVIHNMVYWCQQHVDSAGLIYYSVYKRKLQQDDVKTTDLKLGTSTCLLHHCPLSFLYPVVHGVILVARHPQQKLTFTFALCSLTGQIDLLLSSGLVSVRDLNLHSPVDFRKLLVKCLTYIKQLNNECTVLESLYLPSSQTLLHLYEDGSLVTLDGISTGTSSPFKTVKLQNFLSSDIVELTHMSGAIVVLYKEELRIYKLETGQCQNVLDIQSHLYGAIQGAGHSLLTGHQPVLYMEKDIFIVQMCIGSGQFEDKILLQMSQFQSDAVRLSFIDRMQRFTANQSSTGSIEGLRHRWLKDMGIPPSTRLNETVEPFLHQYWFLEKQLRDGIKSPENVPDMQDVTICDEVTHLVDPTTSTPRSGRPSQLLLLSQCYPAQVVSSLLKYFDIGTGELTTSQQQRWQCLLSSDAGDSDSSLLEMVCHILYKYQPEKLLSFLHRGQQVWEKKVGVSAFIRRKQSLLIYERAVKCLPSPQSSTNPDAATSVHARIILVSEVADCVLKALRLLLNHKRWGEAIDILEKHRSSNNYSLFYQMVLTAVTQNHMLPQYGDKIFKLLPSVESFMDLGKKIEAGGSHEVVCDGDDGISVGAIRPYLLTSLDRETSML